MSRFPTVLRGAAVDAVPLVALVAWVAVADGGFPPVARLALGAAGVFVGARLVSWRSGLLVPVAVVVAVVAMAVARADVLFEGSVHSPLGYSNATAAFFALGVTAALVVACRTVGLPVRFAAVPVAAALATVPLLNGSVAGLLTVVAVVAAIPVAVRGRAAVRLVATAGAAVVVLVAASTAVFGAAHDPGDPVPGWVESTLTSRRLDLWHDAVALVRDRPLTGVGSGEFVRRSPTSRSDVDAAHAHHEYLELAAEEGVVAGLLLLAVFVLPLAGSWRPAADVGTGVVAVALTMVGLHASIDYVLHFPAVALAAAALAGAVQGPGRPAT